MTATALTTALIGALVILPSPAAAQADLAGTWVLDTHRSGNVPPGLEQTLTVRQSGDRIEVETVTTSSGGEQRMQDEFVLDGTEVDFKPPVNPQLESTGRRTSRWSEGGKAFEVAERATINGPQGEVIITATRRWMLAPDGDTLTTEMTINGPQGEQTSTRVFARQR